MENHILSCDSEKCNLCGWCVEACPFGCLYPDPRAEKLCMISCDLCVTDRIDGEPPCVKYCPKKALSLESSESLAQKEQENPVYAHLSALEKESEDETVLK